METLLQATDEQTNCGTSSSQIFISLISQLLMRALDETPKIRKIMKNEVHTKIFIATDNRFHFWKKYVQFHTAVMFHVVQNDTFP
jgi:hypothetical protein